VLETPQDLDWLQGMLNSSIERAGPFLRESFEMPDRSMTAGELVNRLDGEVNIAMASVTAGGEPRVAPIGAIFVRGRFHVPTVRGAARVRQLERNPAISLTYYEGIDVAVIVHGSAFFLPDTDTGYPEVEGLFRGLTGSMISDWGADPLFIVVEPDRIFTFDRHRAGAA
jgi:hypothetical protein